MNILKHFKSLIFTYLIFSIFSLYFFIAELLFFKYTLNGVWTSRILIVIWFSTTLLFIFKYWKNKIIKLYLLLLCLCCYMLILFIGILGSSFLYSIPNLDFNKKFNLGKYSIYIKESFFVGQYSILYKKDLFFKERISKNISKGNDLDNFSDAKIISEENNKILILFKNENDELIIEYFK